MNAKDKIIATDLDGTLFFPKKRFRMLTSSNKKFLRKFIDEGGRLVIVSGRNRFFAKKVINKLKRDADVVGCNSGFIIVNNKTISETPIDNKLICEALKEIRKRYRYSGTFLMSKDYNMVLPRKGFWWFHRICYYIYEIMQGTYKEPSTKSDDVLKSELEHGTVYKLMLFFGVTKKSKMRALKATNELNKLYKDLEFSWCGELIEINQKGCTKANGLKHYLDYRKIKHDNIMVIGDSGNDISMFREFKNSFCMSHAPLHVSKYANHIVNSVSELENYMTDKSEENKIYE